ncbi:MAG: hypothetical protein CVU34_08455 [Betaproteobacteria bacterium HGW-Betaproteobacteria-7]|jgi:hypothetical protein|nr:MAG: hypothetical protein CVU34_08455 [Betaproteobacteria bacterium HGW-Betaproteobacteria-7]
MPKISLISAAVGAAVVVAAFVLNPSPEQHRTEIRSAVAERSPLAGLLGIGALAAFTSTYHPLGVASYTTVNGHVVSIGALGMVFVRQPSDLK